MFFILFAYKMAVF